MNTGKYCKFTAKEILQHPEKYNGENSSPVGEESKTNNNVPVAVVSSNKVYENPDQEVLLALKSMTVKQMSIDLNSVYVVENDNKKNTGFLNVPTSAKPQQETISIMKKTSPIKYYQISNEVKTSCVKALNDLNSNRIQNSYETVYNATQQLAETLK